jgi:hypothetical protein
LGRNCVPTHTLFSEQGEEFEGGYVPVWLKGGGRLLQNAQPTTSSAHFSSIVASAVSIESSAFEDGHLSSSYSTF